MTVIEILKNIAENGRWFIASLVAINLVTGQPILAFWAAMVFVLAMVSDSLTLRGVGNDMPFWLTYALAAVVSIATILKLVW